MSTLAKKTVFIPFGPMFTKKTGDFVPTGVLFNADNVRQHQEGPYSKRHGYDRTVPTFTDASWTAPPESLLPGDGASLLVRDSADRAWSYDPDSITYRDRGRLLRVMPRTAVTLPVALTEPRPVIVEAGNNLWTFAMGSGSYYYAVNDTTAGTLVLAQTTIAASSIVQLAAAYDGTYVWLLYVTGGASVIAHRFTAASPSTAPTITTYQTITTSATSCYALDMRRLSGASETAVLVQSFATGVTPSQKTTHSYLDPATGAAKTSPAAVTTSNSSTQNACGLSILVQDGSGGTWYYAHWITRALNLIAVTTSTLAISSTTALDTSADADALLFGVVMGYVAGNGDRVVYSQTDGTGTATVVRPDEYPITRYTYNGTSVTTLVVARGSWIASKPITYGSAVYFLSGFDDPAVSPVTVGAIQRTLHLRDSDGKIIAQIEYGLASGSYHRVSNIIDVSLGTGTIATYKASFVAPLLTVGTKIIGVSAIQTNAVNAISAAKIEIEMAETFSKPIQFGPKAIAPGAIPLTWTHTYKIHEIAPLVFPHYITRSAGAGAGSTAAAAVYRITDPDGTMWRSSPVLVAGTFGAGDTMTVPTLRHLLPDTTAEIEIYIGTTSPQLQGYVVNDPSVDSLTFVLPTPLRTDETLYTTGGALSASPPPIAKSIAFWRDRVFTSQGTDIFTSLEVSAGFGPRFNEVLKTQWLDGSDDILAMGVVDWNYLAIFKRDAIAVISGPGPDGRGAGNYIVQTLTTKLGCNTLGSIVSGPDGCYFQDTTTGRICRVSPALEVVETAPGTWAYSKYGSGDISGTASIPGPITATLHNQRDRLIQFFDTPGPSTPALIYVIDYQHPTEMTPAGCSYVWSGFNFIAGTATGGVLQAYGACVDATGSVHIESDGVLRRPGIGYQDATSGSPVNVNMRLEINRVQPEGIQGEWGCSKIQAVGVFLSSHDLRLGTSPNSGLGGPGFTFVTKSLTASPAQISTRPPACGRLQKMFLDIAEGSGTGASIQFIGLAIEYYSWDRAAQLNTDRVI